MGKKSRLPLTILIVVLLFTSCEKFAQWKAHREARQRYKALLGQVLHTPDSLQVLYENAFYESDNFDLFSKEYKISTFVNADCGNCIKEFNDWKVIIDDISSKSNISILFYLYTGNLDQFMKVYYPGITLDYPLLVDTLNLYIQQNELNMSGNKNFQTFLINKDNEIIRIGNPITDDNIKKFYLETIQNL